MTKQTEDNTRPSDALRQRHALSFWVDGVQYRVTFVHRIFTKPERFVSSVDIGAHLPIIKKVSRVRGFTFCSIDCMGGMADNGTKIWKRVAIGSAYCSASERGYDKEVGRQYALARALARVDRDLAGPALGAYLSSGKRTLLGLQLRVCPDGSHDLTDLHEIVAEAHEWRDRDKPKPQFGLLDRPIDMSRVKTDYVRERLTLDEAIHESAEVGRNFRSAQEKVDK